MQPPSGLHNLDYSMLFIYEVVKVGCIRCNVLSIMAYVPVCFRCFSVGGSYQTTVDQESCTG